MNKFFRSRDPQIGKVYPDGNGPGHLTEKAYDSRKQAILDERF
jgi:hypothetical protein